MANLKGSTFEKQSKDAYFRLYALSVSRHHNQDSNLTHSLGLEKKRRMYLKNIVDEASKLGLAGKLNLHMGNEEFVKGFLLTRISDMCKKSSLDFISGISSLFEGLRKENISINEGGFDAIEDIRVSAHEMPEDEYRVGRAISNPKYILNKLFEINFESAVIAQVQYETGFRISEAYELVKNQEKYIFNNNIIGLLGKSKHMYEPKVITYDLIQKLSAVEKTPSPHTYAKYLKKATQDKESIPHDWRLTFVKEKYDKYISLGIHRVEALRKISKAINHYRMEMTEYYLLRA